MAEMAAVNFKMDRLTKQQMEKVCADLGMNLTTAFNVFAKAVVRANGLPFELTADPFYSAENQARLRASIAQMEATGGTVHEIAND